MPAYFFDSSAFVKRYISETGSDWINKLIDTSLERFYISRLTCAEVSANLVRRIANAAVVLHDFDTDVTRGFDVISLPNELIDFAVTLIRKHRIRGCDGLQLASALQLYRMIPNLIFVCADNELNIAAQLEGLFIENPNNY